MDNRSPPAEAEALRLLNAGQAADALPLVRRATASATTLTSAHGLLALVLFRLGQNAEALAVIDEAIRLPAGPGDAYDALAFAALQIGAHEQANALYRKAVEHSPGEARFWYNLASSERSFGRLSEAEAACDRAIALDSRHYQSYLLRSELRPQTAQRNHIESMERCLANGASDERACMFLGYALGKELDDIGQYDRAFTWFARAAAARRKNLSYDVTADVQKLARIMEVYASIGPSDASLHRESRNDIFILGLPRSGTTLVEQILTRLPGIRTNGETDSFSNALMAAAAQNGDIFARCAGADQAKVARGYHERARIDGSAKVIEKLPMNYLYIGAIRRALPGATPIVLERSAIDSCFAMYRTLFGSAYPFTYDFNDLAQYYAAYSRLMRHWRSICGDWLVDVSYESLVQDPSRIGASLASACGLIWIDEAVSIERNTGISTTASAAQIRRPIYKSSVGRWRNYRAHLQPLIAALRTAGVSLPEASD
jgi:tetratricopeptide (TPR) repeat protein